MTTPPRFTGVTERKGDMPYRKLGSTGELVSIVGLGGFHLGLPKSDAEAMRLVRAAIDAGITFMDNCWDYHDGLSERRMGKALREGYRERVFLMTKIDARDRVHARQQIDESLRRLRTDCIDLMQIHEVIRPHDPDLVLDDDGAIEALLLAREQGKVRYLGFTGHKDPFIHNRMLDVAEAHGFRFDTVQLPLNVLDAHFRSFALEVVPRLVAMGIGVLGMKPLGGGSLMTTGRVSAIECLHYAMTLPTSTVITGIDSVGVLNQAVEAARTFEPLSPEVETELLTRARPHATGRLEPYKTTFTHDGTAQNPDWLGVL